MLRVVSNKEYRYSQSGVMAAKERMVLYQSIKKKKKALIELKICVSGLYNYICANI